MTDNIKYTDRQLQRLKEIREMYPDYEVRAIFDKLPYGFTSWVQFLNEKHGLFGNDVDIEYYMCVLHSDTLTVWFLNLKTIMREIISQLPTHDEIESVKLTVFSGTRPDYQLMETTFTKLHNIAQ